jgi:hypothetical protein
VVICKENGLHSSMLKCMLIGMCALREHIGSLVYGHRYPQARSPLN